MRAVAGRVDRDADGEGANAALVARWIEFCKRLYEGQTLAAALARASRRAFPTLYVATVRASERSGAMREALTRYVAYQQQVDVLRKSWSMPRSIRRCSRRGRTRDLFLLGYVVPRFSGIYEEFGEELPLASRMLLKWGQLLQAHDLWRRYWHCARRSRRGLWLSRPPHPRGLGALIARIPTFGQQLRLYQLARLYRTVGMLLRGGMPAVTALQMSAGSARCGIEGALRAATQDVRDGQVDGQCAWSAHD